MRDHPHDDKWAATCSAGWSREPYGDQRWVEVKLLQHFARTLHRTGNACPGEHEIINVWPKRTAHDDARDARILAASDDWSAEPPTPLDDYHMNEGGDGDVVFMQLLLLGSAIAVIVAALL